MERLYCQAKEAVRLKTNRKKRFKKATTAKKHSARRGSKSGSRASTTRGSVKGSGAAAATMAEVALFYGVRRTPEALENLAKLLGRRPGAIESIWRAIDGDFGSSPPGAKLRKQIANVRENFGTMNHGRLELRAPVAPVQVTETTYSTGCSTNCDTDTTGEREYTGSFSFH